MITSTTSFLITIGLDKECDINPKKATKKEIVSLINRKYGQYIRSIKNWETGRTMLIEMRDGCSLSAPHVAFTMGCELQREIDKIGEVGEILNKKPTAAENGVKLISSCVDKMINETLQKPQNYMSKEKIDRILKENEDTQDIAVKEVLSFFSKEELIGVITRLNTNTRY